MELRTVAPKEKRIVGVQASFGYAMPVRVIHTINLNQGYEGDAYPRPGLKGDDAR